MINISNLTSNKNNKPFLFSDLNLNFEEKKVSRNQRNSDIVSGNDLVVDYDVEAIKNSIRNCLFQKRYLVNLNVNLYSYIGKPINETNALLLGEDIQTALSNYEPRIKVNKIYVGLNIDQSAYYISMLVKILNLGVDERIDSIFQKDGNFNFINTI